MRTIRLRFWLLGVAMLAALATGGDADAQVTDPVPFNVSYGGSYNVASHGVDGFRVLANTVGVDPLLGFSTAVSKGTVTFVGPTALISATFTFTASDGSVLKGSLSGRLATTKSGFYTNSCTFTISGGSGRFSNATGKGNCTVAALAVVPVTPPSLTTGIFDFTLNGFILP